MTSEKLSPEGLNAGSSLAGTGVFGEGSKSLYLPDSGSVLNCRCIKPGAICTDIRSS